MTTAEIPVAELRERAETRQFRPGYALSVIIAWICAGLGWTAGRGLVVLGWTAGRAWLIGVFMAEAVIYGFRNGAGLPPSPSPPAKAKAGAESPPAR
jgi:hypothetical protein